METLRSNVTDTALIFEGGGMRASYTSAVVRVLLEAGIHVDWVAGISAGASNTVNYLSRDEARSRRSFVDFAADPNFGGWNTWLRGKGVFSAEYIYEHTSGAGQAMPFDFATFQANPARMQLGSFCCETGEEVWFGRDDCPTVLDLMRRVRASSSIPILMPMVTIGRHRFVDGALGAGGGIPIDRAIAAGFEKFFVVLTQERDYVKPPMRNGAFFRQVFRRYPAVAHAIMTRAQHYNASRQKLFELERCGRAMLFCPDHMDVTSRETDVAKLAASHEAGLAQARRELPRWREFLGV